MAESKEKSEGSWKPTQSNYELLVEGWVDRGLIERDALRMSPSRLSSLVMSSIRGPEAAIESVAQKNTTSNSVFLKSLAQQLQNDLDFARQRLEKDKADFDQQSKNKLNKIDRRWKKLDEDFVRIGAQSRLWLRDSLNQVFKHMKEIGETQDEVDEIRKCGDQVWAMFGNWAEIDR